MKLISTSTCCGKRFARGTAEIELLLLIPLLLTILFIAGVMLTLGPARIQNPSEAERLAYQDATAATDPTTVSDDPGPVADPVNEIVLGAGITADLPELPNRLHVATATTALHIGFGNISMPPVTLTDQAAFGSPALTCSGWPVSSDVDTESQWMQRYAEFSIGAADDPSSIAGALELAPSYPP